MTLIYNVVRKVENYDNNAWFFKDYFNQRQDKAVGIGSAGLHPSKGGKCINLDADL